VNDVNLRRRLVVLSALRWFPVGLVIPVLVLLLGARGLSLAQVGQVMAVYSVVTLSLELPTGGMADAWGRRPVIIGSALLQTVGLAILALLGSVPFVVLGVALLGTARALSSGPVESWFVDAMNERGDPAVEPGLAGGQIAEALALGAGAVIGGLLPSLARALPSEGTGLVQMSVPFLAAAAMAVVHAAMAALLLTPATGPRGSVGRTVGTAVTVAVRHANVRRLVAVAGCLGLVLSGIELLAPGRFAELSGSTANGAAVFGVLTAAAFAASAGGAAVSTRLPGRRGMVGGAAFLAMALLALALALPLIAGAAAGYLLLYVAVGVQGPALAGLLHARISSEVRSTMMSVESLALQAGGAVASLLIGAVATHVGLLAALGAVTAGGLVAAVLLAHDARVVRSI
jgi:predicted MFS family arabinose efflux permease